MEQQILHLQPLNMAALPPSLNPLSSLLQVLLQMANSTSSSNIRRLTTEDMLNQSILMLPNNQYTLSNLPLKWVHSPISLGR